MLSDRKNSTKQNIIEASTNSIISEEISSDKDDTIKK